MKIKTNSQTRIRLESFNHELLGLSCQKIIKIVQNLPLNSISVIPLPTHKRIYCVLRSPHVNKDSREHFEIRIHKRILEIYYDITNIDINISNLLAEVDLPPGVFCQISFSQNKTI